MIFELCGKKVEEDSNGELWVYKKDGERRRARKGVCQNPDCNKDFYTPASEPAIYCSRGCVDEMQRKSKTDHRIGAIELYSKLISYKHGQLYIVNPATGERRKGVILKCQTCHKSKIYHISDIKYRGIDPASIVCYECQHNGSGFHRIADDELFVTNARGTRDRAIQKECIICNASFLTRKDHNAMTCSAECKGLYIAQLQQDQSLQNPIHKSNSAAQWLLKWECVDCKEAFRPLLQLHHIDGNPANNPTDGSNWEVLCSSHHELRHMSKNKYGEWRRYTKALTPRELLPELLKLCTGQSILKLLA